MNPHTKRLLHDAARHDRAAREQLERAARMRRRNRRRQEVRLYLDRKAA